MSGARSKPPNPARAGRRRRLATVADARKIILTSARLIGAEAVPVEASLGRVLARDVVSRIGVPHFEKAGMDGYAVRSKDIHGADRKNPVSLRLVDTLYAGDVPHRAVDSGTCIAIATGAMMPKGADAVVMVEDTRREGELVRVYAHLSAGKNVVRAGSDILQGQRVLPEGLTLAPRHTAVLSALGLRKVYVRRKPTVAVLSTGNELIPAGGRLAPGKIYGINSRAIADALVSAGALVTDLGVVADDRRLIQGKIRAGIKRADVLLISGGSSVGQEDLVPPIVASMGRVLVHGVSMKPGKPLLVGKVSGRLVVGLPGYPTSALTVFHAFVIPLLYAIMGKSDDRIVCEAALSEPFKTGERHMFLPVKLAVGERETVAVPVFRGSSAITSLALADGFTEVPPNAYIRKNQKVSVVLF